MSNDSTLIHPEDGMVYACPHCDHAPVRERSPGKALYEPEFVYYCHDCQTGFDDPVERETKNDGGGKMAKHGLARKLEEMSPDEVGA